MVTAANPTWTFDPILHLYRDENAIPIPSVTQAMKAAGLISFDGISPRVLEHKRQLGVLVHKLTELCDKGENLNDFDVPDECLPYIEGYVNFRNDCGFTPELIEHRMLATANGMRYGMTLDRTGSISGIPHLIELKCGASEHPAWGVQLAAYAIGIMPPNQRTRIARAAVQLGPKFKRNYKLHAYDDPADFHVWMSSLSNTIWLQNKKLFVFENLPERLEAA